jgi:hypothetical protein
MPPEKRNSALMEVKIAIEGVQYDMVLEQKDLIMNIIDELIAENDADQIAKSNLVFVPDVEEQIAPTKKTRAKKVVKPVTESTLEDLPDFISKQESIRNFPEQLKKLVEFRSKQQGLNLDLSNNLAQQFTWNRTLEGEVFWDRINYNGDLRDFKKLYGNKGEKVDEIIEFAELNEFAGEFLNPEESTPAPAIKTRKPRTPKAPAVAESTLEDLPNFINSGMIIKDLPKKIKLLALQRQKDAGNIPNENLSVDAFKVNGNFDWIETPEGNNFWEIIYADGDLRDFKKLYGNKGEGVDAIINAPAPAIKTRKPRTPPVPVEKPKPVPVEKPKPVAVEKPKPVKVEKPKPVKITKPKPTKPKVEDDLSFLNDLDNIF